MSHKDIQEIDVCSVKALFSLRSLAEYFDCFGEDGKPATETIRDWWHSGRIPPPDVRMSREAVYWKPETIRAFVENGGGL
jgi:hypothetical protein